MLTSQIRHIGADMKLELLQHGTKTVTSDTKDIIQILLQKFPLVIESPESLRE